VLPDAEISYYPYFFDQTEADHYLNELISQVAWSQQTINLYGKTHKIPRLSAWYADAGKSYEYSGLRSEGLPWLAILTEIKQRIKTVCSAEFNGVLANRYRNGADGVGWHADDEPELGRNPVIASLSFGAKRNFQLKHKRDKSQKQSIILAHGSLLIMQAETQHHWLHQIAKTTRHMDERVNLTFRLVK